MQNLQLRKQLEEKTKEAAKYRELAEKEQVALDQLIQACKDSDVDVSDAEKPKLDFEAAMASKDYQGAVGAPKVDFTVQVVDTWSVIPLSAEQSYTLAVWNDFVMLPLVAR